MEQESEGQHHQQGMQMEMLLQQAVEFDKKVRKEANSGAQQVRHIEQQLRKSPHIILGRADGGAEVQTLRAAMITASATIVQSFSRIISLLSTPPHPTTTTGTATNSPSRNDNFSTGLRADSPMSTAHTSDTNSTPASPPQVDAAATTTAIVNRLLMYSSSPVMSPCHTPHSGSALSEGSPANPPFGGGEYSDGEMAAVAAGGRRHPRAQENSSTAASGSASASAAADPELMLGDQLPRPASKKRKFMPKYTCKQRATGTEDGPPDDGHTWRKYGQKDILGSRYPRSYYRCTHKIELGCPATKFVQRSDEEPTVFDVTYRGGHTCQAMQQNLPWPFHLHPEHFFGSHFPPPDPSSTIMTFPPRNVVMPGNTHVNSHSSPGAPARAMVASSPDDHLIVRNTTGPSFPQPSVGLNTARSGRSSSPAMAEFGLSSSPSMKFNGLQMQMDNRELSSEPEAAHPCHHQSPPVSNRENLFGPNSNFLSHLLANSTLSSTQDHDGQRSTLDDSSPQGLGGGVARSYNQRQHGEIQLPGDDHHQLGSSRNDSNTRSIEKSSSSSQEAHYVVENWGQDIDNCFPPQLSPQQEMCTYNCAPIVSETGRSRGPVINYVMTPGGGGPDMLRMNNESEDSEFSYAPPPFAIGYMDSPLGIFDYEPIMGNSFPGGLKNGNYYMY